MKAIEDLSQEEKRKAIEAAKAITNAAEGRSVGGVTPSSDEATGSFARTPGYDEHSGKTLKPAAQWPQTKPVVEPPLVGKTTEFDKALKAAQQQDPRESLAQDKGHNLDR